MKNVRATCYTNDDSIEAKYAPRDKAVFFSDIIYDAVNFQLNVETLRRFVSLQFRKSQRID